MYSAINSENEMVARTDMASLMRHMWIYVQETQPFQFTISLHKRLYRAEILANMSKAYIFNLNSEIENEQQEKKRATTNTRELPTFFFLLSLCFHFQRLFRLLKHSHTLCVDLHMRFLNINDVYTMNMWNSISDKQTGSLTLNCKRKKNVGFCSLVSSRHSSNSQPEKNIVWLSPNWILLKISTEFLNVYKLFRCCTRSLTRY